ncbi:MAG: squalene/phytoene synthase family protein [Succinivibrionaceae bacterium]|nr:squalene/phytoene synthase family protein [Succinivibrionaceae bacterium]
MVEERHPLTEEEQSRHLGQVSRTFALTIPMLPGELRDQVANAYLLCRIADTVEDDPVAGAEERIAWLKRFSRAAARSFADPLELQALEAAGLGLVQGGAREAELALMGDLGRVVGRTLTYPVEARGTLCRGVALLAAGMARALRGLSISDRHDVDLYCYFVAGVVGETLALLFSSGEGPGVRQRLLDLSVSFGEGLQLTNILKDRAEDAARGARFLPPPAGGEGEAGLLRRYAALTAGHLADARDFTLAIPRRLHGARAFCFMNLAMANLTVRRILAAGDAAGQPPKISHAQVGALLALRGLAARSNLALRTIFSLTAPKVAMIARDPAALRAEVSWWDRDLEGLLANV